MLPKMCLSTTYSILQWRVLYWDHCKFAYVVLKQLLKSMFCQTSVFLLDSVLRLLLQGDNLTSAVATLLKGKKEKQLKDFNGLLSTSEEGLLGRAPSLIHCWCPQNSAKSDFEIFRSFVYPTFKHASIQPSKRIHITVLLAFFCCPHSYKVDLEPHTHPYYNLITV